MNSPNFKIFFRIFNCQKRSKVHKIPDKKAINLQFDCNNSNDLILL
jgi:hypothetical protein